jgi:hypothetical protein
MMNDDDFEFALECLTGHDVMDKVYWCQIHLERPGADPRVLPYLEPLLTDTTPCCIALPPHYAELRWMAAQAMASELNACGIRDNRVLEGLVLPLSERELIAAAMQAGIADPKWFETFDRDNLEACIPTLRDAGLLTLVDYELSKGPGTLVPWKTEHTPTGGYPISKKSRA